MCVLSVDALFSLFSSYTFQGVRKLVIAVAAMHQDEEGADVCKSLPMTRGGSTKLEEQAFLDFRRQQRLPVVAMLAGQSGSSLFVKDEAVHGKQLDSLIREAGGARQTCGAHFVKSELDVLINSYVSFFVSNKLGCNTLFLLAFVLRHFRSLLKELLK